MTSELAMCPPSHLVRNDPQFQAVYDAVLVQAAIFMIYVVVHDSWIAGG